MSKAELEDERETRGIAAFLLGLAVLAGLLCIAPLSLRVRTLSIMRPAEAIARAFALDYTGGALVLPESPEPEGDSRADALQLARCFRALACFFCGLRSLAAEEQAFPSTLTRQLSRRAPTPVSQAIFVQVKRVAAFGAPILVDTS